MAATGVADYRALIADFADVTTVATVGGVYRYVTPACQRAFGWAPSQVEGRNQDDLVHPDDIPSAQTCRSNLTWGKVATGSYRLRCGDGSYRWA
ncbi:MAG: PAS domain-containing protein, partial [Actinomycetes bacterium]